MSRTRLPGLTALAISVLAFLLAGCGDEGDVASPGAPSTSSSPSPDDSPAESGDCPEVIPDAVVSELGWAPADGAVEGRGGCTWTGPEGTITTYETANTASRACGLLEDAAPPGTYRDDIDTASGGPACGYLRDTDVGQSELALSVDSRTISIVVVSLESTPPAAVEQALSALTATAEEVA